MLILIFSFYVPTRFIPIVYGAGESWLTGWTYRKQHTIANASEASTNYQVGIKTYYGAGTDGTETVLQIPMGKVYLDSKCRTDFGDVRFTDDDGDTPLDYWMENKTDSSFAIFWVEVADNLNDTAQIIYIYYGNAGVSTTSNGTLTFPFFDDFSSGEITGQQNHTVIGTTVTRDMNTWLYYDFGEDHFNALDIDFQANITAGASGIMGVFALANGIDDLANLASPAVNVIIHESGGTEKIWLNRGPQTGNDDFVCEFDKVYYMTLNRSAGNDEINLYIFDEYARTTHLDTLTVAGYGTAKYRYFYAMDSWDSDNADRTISGTSGKFSIDGGATLNLMTFTEQDPTDALDYGTRVYAHTDRWVEEYATSTINETAGTVRVIGNAVDEHGVIYGVTVSPSGMIRWNVTAHQATETNSGNAGGVYPDIASVGRDIFYWCTFHTDYSEARLRINDVDLYNSTDEEVNQPGIIDVYFKEGFGMIIKNGSVQLNETDAALSIPDGLRPWIGVYEVNDGYIDADYVFVREFVLPEPIHGAWGSEETLGNDPTITSASISDMDDSDNCYEMESYYTFTAVVNDADGATDIASVYLQIKQGAAVRVEVRATSLDGAPSYAIQTGATISDLDTGNCAWGEAGDVGTATFKIRFEFDYTDEANLEIAVYVEDTSAASAGFTDQQTDYFDVIGRLVTTGFAAADGRIDLNTATTFSGNVYYATTVGGDTASTKYPPDAQFTAVHIHNAGHATQGNDATIVNGAFAGISVTVPDAVQSNTYHVYLDLVADYTDADAPDGDTVAVIGDRVYATATTVSDSHDDINDDVTIDWTLKYEHDDELYDNGDEVVTIEGSTANHIGSGVWRVTENSAVVNSTTYDEFTASGDPYSLTAVNANSQTNTVIWDRFDIISVALSDSRVNGGTNSEVRYVIQYDQDNTVFTDVEGSIAGFVYDGGNSWWDKTVTAPAAPGADLYDENDITITDSTYGLTEKEDDAGVNLIGDRLQATGTTISDTRDDIEDDVTIDWTIIYDYDNAQVTDGIIDIEGTDADHQGSGVWRVTENSAVVNSTTYNEFTGSGNTYGISLIDINGQTDTVIWDKLEFVSIAVDDSRINVGTTFEIRYVIRYDQDDVAFDDTKGSITGFAWDGVNSWWDKTVTGDTVVTSTNYDETYPSITDTTYSLTEKEDEAGVDVITTRPKLLTLTSTQGTNVDLDTPVFYYATVEDEYDGEDWATGDTFSLSDVPFIYVADKFVSSEQKYSDDATLTLDSFTTANEATYGIDETGANMNGLSFTTIWGEPAHPPSGPIAPAPGGVVPAPSVTYEGTVIIDEGGGLIITPTPRPLEFGTIGESIWYAILDNSPIILMAAIASIFLIPGVVEEKKEEKVNRLKKSRSHRTDKGAKKKKIVKRKKKKPKEFI